MVRLFQTTAYHVSVYASADTLLAELDDLAPKCLVVDFHMPRMNALEFLDQLERKGASIPTIVITAFDEPETRRRCLAAGASAYFTKPIRRAELLATIDSLIA